MSSAGFRAYPGREIVAKWEETGGRWQARFKQGDDPYILWPRYTSPPALRVGASTEVRPIHPEHGWSHFPWMWAELTGESMVPTKPGWYWWQLCDGDVWVPVLVVTATPLCVLVRVHEGRMEPITHGQWGGSIEGMPR